ncbi:MAG TPA: zinc-dependent alcohol dehydrogenase family protein [Firmicutes bacterium]|nr:zinc-dependent alcohol dehydrogenase family protein [Candidatus Fermentithermobacillaceae bacterium]
MKAMVLREPAPVETEPLVLEDVPVPEAGPGEVRIKVRYCGVCRTDLHIVEGELVCPRLPIVPGHQVVGVVDSIGPENPPSRVDAGTGGPSLGADPGEVLAEEGLKGPGSGQKSDGLSLGDRVGMAWLYGTCGECEHCASGNENLCDHPRFTGFSVNGGYEEYMVAPASFLVKIPDSFADLEAAPLLCAGIIGYRSIKVAGLKPGETLGLFGFGASAHLAIQVARHWGCQVLVFTRSKEHQKHALELGASWAGTAGDVPPDSCHRIITFAPAGYLIPYALKALKKGGTLAINAVHMDKIPELDYGLVYWEKKIVTVANATRRDADEFMRLAAEIPLKVSTEVFSLEKANEALLKLKKGQIRGEAVLKI